MILVEGVPYHRYRVRFRLKTGQRRQRTVLSPGYPWVRTEVARFIDSEFGVENVKPGSCRIDLTE